jgi:hypothetical protein
MNNSDVDMKMEEEEKFEVFNEEAEDLCSYCNQ